MRDNSVTRRIAAQRVAGAVAALCLLQGCNGMNWGGGGYGSGGGVGVVSIYGSDGAYLGCFCNQYDRNSVFNAYGTYGSRYSATSIWNRYGNYGSDYSHQSACNRFATSPPIVVNASGQVLGHLTVNTYKANAYRDAQVHAWLTGTVCR